MRKRKATKQDLPKKTQRQRKEPSAASGRKRKQSDTDGKSLEELMSQAHGMGITDPGGHKGRKATWKRAIARAANTDANGYVNGTSSDLAPPPAGRDGESVAVGGGGSGSTSTSAAAAAIGATVARRSQKQMPMESRDGDAGGGGDGDAGSLKRVQIDPEFTEGEVTFTDSRNSNRIEKQKFFFFPTVEDAKGPFKEWFDTHPCSLLLCVTGDAQGDVAMKPFEKERFFDHLGQAIQHAAIQHAAAWITTGGTECGVMKLMGEMSTALEI